MARPEFPSAPLLKPRHRLFAEQYLIDLSGKAAALRAGFAPQNPSRRAVLLLRRPAIRAAIGAAMAARAARTGITAERVLAEYAAIAFADPRRFADWEKGEIRFRSAGQLAPADTRAIAELVDERRFGAARRQAKPGAAGPHLRRVKLFDKLAALRSLARILGHADRARFRAPAPLPLPRLGKRRVRPQFTARQKRFAAEYVKDFAGTAAAIRAGYAAGGARTTATALLSHPHVVALIEAQIAAQRTSIRAAADRVLAEYARLAFADMARIADWDRSGFRLKPQRRLAAEDSAAIQFYGAAFDVWGPSGPGTRLRLYDKVAALDALARHLGLLDRRMPGEGAERKPNERRTRAILRARLDHDRLGWDRSGDPSEP